jgi:hypothetical protein
MSRKQRALRVAEHSCAFIFDFTEQSCGTLSFANRLQARNRNFLLAGAASPCTMASVAAAKSYPLTQSRGRSGWLTRLAREIRRQAAVRGRLATVQGQNRVTLPTPKGGSNREYQADLRSGAILPYLTKIAIFCGPPVLRVLASEDVTQWDECKSACSRYGMLTRERETVEA